MYNSKTHVIYLHYNVFIHIKLAYYQVPMEVWVINGNFAP